MAIRPGTRAGPPRSAKETKPSRQGQISRWTVRPALMKAPTLAPRWPVILNIAAVPMLGITMAAWSATSTCWPWSVASRASRAKTTPTAPARPVDGEGDAALRGVEREPEERAVGIGRPAPEGRPPAGRIALRRLHLHHVGAEVAEDLAGEEAGLVREVEDADAGEGVAQQAADASRPSREVSSSTARLPPVLGGPFARRPPCAKTPHHEDRHRH